MSLLEPTHLKVVETNRAFGEITIEATCSMCGGHKRLALDEAKFKAWLNREIKIQEAFPDLSSEQREWLLTGFDQRCWDELWAEEES